MYIVKIGDFYVKEVDVAFGGFINEIILSKEIMHNFNKEVAERIAKMTYGEMIKIKEE